MTSTDTGTTNGDCTGGLAMTGPASMMVAVAAAIALGAGNLLLSGGRVARWNARRWRPRHATRRFRRS